MSKCGLGHVVGLRNGAITWRGRAAAAGAKGALVGMHSHFCSTAGRVNVWGHGYWKIYGQTGVFCDLKVLQKMSFVYGFVCGSGCCGAGPDCGVSQSFVASHTFGASFPQESWRQKCNACTDQRVSTKKLDPSPHAHSTEAETKSRSANRKCNCDNTWALDDSYHTVV